MESTNADIGLSINDLPNEILLMIFHLLPPKSLSDCTLVCRSWMHLADSCNTSTLVVDCTNQFEFISPARTIKRNHRKLSIQRFYISEVTPNLATVSSTAAEISLQDVSFCDYATYAAFFRAAGDLRYLEMDTPVIREPEAAVATINEESPESRVEQLDLILRDEELVTWAVLKITELAQVSVQKLFLFLDLEMEFRDIEALCDYIAQHYQKALTKLKISKWNTDGTMVAPVVLRRLTQMPDLQLELLSIEEPVDDRSFLQFAQQNQTYLRVLEMGNFNADQWATIVSHLALEELFLKIRPNVEFSEINFKISVLTRLKKVTLALLQPNIVEIEVSCLSQLPVLEHFSLDDKTENRPLFRLTQIGAQSLSRLKELFLGHLTMGYETFQTIFKSMQCLEVLVLYSIFGVEQNGLLGNKNTEDLSIASLKYLKYLAIDSYGVNDEVLKEMKLPHLTHLEFYGYVRLITYTNAGLRDLRTNCPLLRTVITDQQNIDLDCVSTDE